MKVLRADARDYAAIGAIHELAPLDLETLVFRFQHEMTAVIGDPARIRGQFLGLVARLFPRDVDAVAARLAKWGLDLFGSGS
jgi:hypothetical protein